MNDEGYAHDPTLSIDRKVAIVGIGCRFPNNINNVEDFWRVISKGEDCMIPHPPERLDPSYIYPGETLPGKIYTLRAGYLKQDVYAFDREFFQMSPDEASHMDPQQRILLEVAFEALENYGVDVGALRKSQTGVFIGVMAKEYINYLIVPVHANGPYTGTGNNTNMLSNRISYQFDFQGPSVTVDTACSSSLYAIHFACEAIRNKECNLALAGGVNLLLLGATTAQLCQARMISKDGYCKSFDQTADGYARGEGAGVLVLKSLENALADGDKIYAVIRGGALNNDGKTKGITSPNPQSQLNLLKTAYEVTNTPPEDVTYVEAHGTGTQAGDVAESTALGSVIGIGDRNHNLIIGSVKSNFGHTEGAAGVAGVIKSALVLDKKQIPQIVHFQNRNEDVDWEKFQITLPAELMDWPKNAKYLAGCNSFGFGGANAHIVLEAAPNRMRHNDKEEVKNGLPSILFLSAESKEALTARVANWVEYLKSPGTKVENFQSILLTAALRATHHQHRLALYCESKEQTIRVLKKRAANSGDVDDALVEGQVQKITKDKNKLAFVFSGMGTQWWAMGRQLMATDQTFRTSILEMDKLLRGFGADWSLYHILGKETNDERIHDTAIAQPAICAVQIALVRVYRRYGIFPKMVVGHSVGEVAAAHVAGYLSLRDAMRLIFVRGLSLRRTVGKGKMAAILAPANDVRERLEMHEYVDKIDIACVNSSEQTVISGSGDAVERFVESWEAQGVRCVVLKVQNAFHSFQQEEVKEYFLKQTKFLQPPTFQLGDKYIQPQIPMVSTVNNEFLSSQTLNSSEYWWGNIRQTVEFSKSLYKLFVNGCNIFIEIGPHPSLASVIKTEIGNFSEKSISFFHESCSVISSLRRSSDTSRAAHDRRNVMLSIAKLHMQGYDIQLDLLFPVTEFTAVALPKYPWQHDTYNAASSQATKLYISPRSQHPLLGKQAKPPFTATQTGDNYRSWKSKYERTDLPWLHHHKIGNVVVLPGAAFIEIMLSAASDTLPNPLPVTIHHVEFHKFHYSPESKGTLYTTMNRLDGNNKECQISVKTFDKNERSWVTNASCSFRTSNRETECAQECLNLRNMKDKMSSKYTVDDLYKKLSDSGVQIGPLFRAMTSAHFNEDMSELLVFAEIPPVLRNESDLYTIHPSLLDACFQVVGIFKIVSKSGRQVKAVPKSVGSLHIQEPIPPKIAIHAKQVHVNSSTSLDVKIVNRESGEVLAYVTNIQLQSIGPDEQRLWVWQREWVRIDTSLTQGVDESQATKSTCCCIIPDNLGVSEQLMESLLSDGVYTAASIRLGEIDNEGSVVNILPPDNVDLQHLIVLNSINESARTVSPNETSREEFIVSQTDAALNLIREIINVFSRNHTHTVAIWIVTKGAMLVPSADTCVDPFMSKGMALPLVSANETPELFVATIDLPLAATVTQSHDMLRQFFKMPMMSESCIALRRSAVDGKSKKAEYDAFALRVTSKPSPDFVDMIPCEAWAVDLQRDDRRNATSCVKPWKESRKPLNPDSSEVIIKLEAFARQPFKEIEQSCDDSKAGFFFVGFPVSDASTTKSKLSKDHFAGFCRRKLVTSTLTCKKPDLVMLPHNVSPTEVVAVLKKCLPLFAAFQRVKVLPGAVTNILFLVANALQIHYEFAERFARSKDVNITIVTERKGDETSYDGIRILPKYSVGTRVSSSSVDTLIICPSFQIEERYLYVLLGKMRVFGDIIVIGGMAIDSVLLRSRQIHEIDSDVEVLLSRAHKSVANELLKSLLTLMFENGECSGSFIGSQDAIPLDEVTPELLGSGVIRSVSPVEVPFDFNDFDQRFHIESLASYLVVGGTKGFGFEVACWLVAHGAEKVYISGRNTLTGEISDTVESLGGKIEFVKCDISDENQTTELLTAIKDRVEFPLEGVFHCAAVFADQSLENVTEDMWNKVMMPKAYGALLIHQITLKLRIQLKYFVLFSSMTEYLGNAGQGAYCTANTFLTSLCQFRRCMNLPATAVAPGAISQVGYAAREGYDELFESRGVMSVAPAQMNEALSWSLMTGSTDFGLTGELNKQLFGISSPLILMDKQTQHISVIKGLITAEDTAFLRNRENVFSGCGSPAEAHALIINVLEEFLKSRLGVTSAISDNVSLSSYGLDSGMAFELSALMKSSFKTTISSVELLSDVLIISDIVSLVYQRASSRKENDVAVVKRNLMADGTPWLAQPMCLETASVDLFCFPSTGNGMTMFMEMADTYKQSGIRVWVAHLPGWEGRMDEKPSCDLSYLVEELAACILPRVRAARTAFLGCGIGALLSTEVMRALQNREGISIDNLFVIGWYPPSVPFSVITAVDSVSKDNREKTKTDSKPFLDNRDIRHSHLSPHVIQNIRASTKLCTEYIKEASAPIKSNVLVFSGKRDLLLSSRICSKWRDEVHPDYTFKHAVLQTDHKLLRNKNTHTHIVSKIVSVLESPIAQ